MKYVIEHNLDFEYVKFLLYAGAKIGTPTEKSVLSIALKNVINSDGQGRQRNYEKLKILIKHVFLENHCFNIEHLLGKRTPEMHSAIDSELNKLARKCSKAIKLLKEKKLDPSLTLFEYISRHNLSQDATSVEGFQIDNSQFEEILTLLKDNDFSIYLDLIAEKVGKAIILSKFQEVKVYASTNNSEMKILKEKTFLNYDCLEFLSAGDLMRMFFAYSPIFNKNNNYKRKQEAEDVKKRCKLCVS